MMLSLILRYFDKSLEALESEVPFSRLIALPVRAEWWAWQDDIWIDYFRTDFKIDSEKYSSRMDDLKNKFNNQYCGYIHPRLKLKDGTEYEFEQIWSEQKVFPE